MIIILFLSKQTINTQWDDRIFVSTEEKEFKVFSY